MSRPPLVSVLIPTYNQQASICRAVDSALAQTYKNVEVVVSDDCSVDGTGQLVMDRYGERIRYHRHPENVGRVRNYRHGLYELARGEWVVNLDGDDFFVERNFIARAIELVSSDRDLVIVSGKKIARRGGVDVVQPNLGNKKVAGVEVVLNYHIQRYHLPHMASLYCRAKALECDFYRADILSADWESLLRLALCGSVAYIDADVGVWEVHGQNASHSSSAATLAENLELWQSVFAECHKVGVEARLITEAARRSYRASAKRDFAVLCRAADFSGLITYARQYARERGWLEPLSALLRPSNLGRVCIGAVERVLQ